MNLIAKMKIFDIMKKENLNLVEGCFYEIFCL